MHSVFCFDSTGKIAYFLFRMFDVTRQKCPEVGPARTANTVAQLLSLSLKILTINFGMFWMGGSKTHNF